MNPQKQRPELTVVGPDPEEARVEAAIIQAAEAPQTDDQLDKIAAALEAAEGRDWGDLPAQPDPRYRIGWCGSVEGAEPPPVDERLGAPNLFVGIGPAGLLRAAESNAVHSIAATSRSQAIVACTRIGLRVALEPSGANPEWIALPMIGGNAWPGAVADADGRSRSFAVPPDWLAAEAPNLARCAVQENPVETQILMALITRGGICDFPAVATKEGVSVSRSFLDTISITLVHGLGLDGMLATVGLGRREDGSFVITDFVPWWTPDILAAISENNPGKDPWEIAVAFFRMIDTYQGAYTPPELPPQEPPHS